LATCTSVWSPTPQPAFCLAGSRYLDLRVAYSPAQGGYYFTHCLTSVASVPQQLQSLSAYIASTYAASVTRPNGQAPEEVRLARVLEGGWMFVTASLLYSSIGVIHGAPVWCWQVQLSATRWLLL